MLKKLLALTVIPIVVLSIIFSCYSIYSITDMTKKEVIQGLQSVTIAYSSLFQNEGNQLKVDESGVTKDGQAISDFDLFNLVKKEADVDLTVFYKDTRVLSTIHGENGKSVIGTKADSEVVKDVVDNGKTYESRNLKIHGERYCCFYYPIKDSNGDIVGMMFAGKSTADVDKVIVQKSIVIIALSVVTLLAVILLVVFFIRKIIAVLDKVTEWVKQVAEGDFTITVDKDMIRRKDELGGLGKLSQELANSLGEIMVQVRESAESVAESATSLSQLAEQTNTTTNDIGKAITDIADGAYSQAKETEQASQSMQQMGQEIDNLVLAVNRLNDSSNEMKQAENDANVIMKDLGISNEKSISGVHRIVKQVGKSNDAAAQISQAVEMIATIAEETSLLSLNASIEAARAGEAGKGFAVVATQIQKLAEQSNDSAKVIEEIVNELMEQSNKTVLITDEMKNIIEEQSCKLEDTKKHFESVENGINESLHEINEIDDRVSALNQAKTNVTESVKSLSAIAEENAAATEETTASIEEINATINTLASSAKDLNELSLELKQEIAVFTIE